MIPKDLSAAQKLAARMYAEPAVVQTYARLTGLMPVEERLVAAYAASFRGALLDVGVGAGRTTAALAPGASSYVGLDFSAEMIAEARRRYPRFDLRTLDMREVPKVFADRRFDVVLLSYNTIDHVSWADRTALLVGLRQLLAPEGLLVFSTHSLDEGVTRAIPIDGQRLAAGAQLLPSRPRAGARMIAAELMSALRAIGNRLRFRRHEVVGDGHAFINDPAHGHASVVCYVSDARQRRALEGVGYEVLARLPQRETGPSDWHYYVCRSRV